MTLDKKPKWRYRLFIKVRDKHIPIQVDAETGRQLIAVKWLEVVEANLGSCKNPNKEILEYKFIPVDENGNQGQPFDVFRALFGG